MAKEIERKFLVAAAPFDLSMRPDWGPILFHRITQGYPDNSEGAPIVRVVITAEDGATLQLRGVLSIDVRIPQEEAAELLTLYANPNGVLEKDLALRFRVQDDNKGFITLKGPGSDTGMSRDEFEYALSPTTAQLALDVYCRSLRLSKIRYRIPHGDLTIELDVFEGPLSGEVIAEIELPTEDTPLVIPSWFGREVTKDKSYSNFNLAKTAAYGGNRQATAELALVAADNQSISFYSSTPVPVGELEATSGFPTTDKSINDVRLVRVQYAPRH